MKDYPTGPQMEPASDFWETITNGFRFIVGAVGMTCLIAGMVFAVGTFQLIRQALANPTEQLSLVEEWAQVAGGDDLNITIQGETYKPAKIVSICVLGAGCVVLAHIALAFITTGARVSLWAIFRRDPQERLSRNKLLKELVAETLRESRSKSNR